MTNVMTGAEMVVRALRDGESTRFSAIRAAPSCRFTMPCFTKNTSSMCWCATNKAPPMRPKALPVERQGGCFAGDLGSWRHQCGDRLDRCAHQIDPGGLHHRPGADPSGPTLGMRSSRYHPSLHQAQLPRPPIKDTAANSHEAFYVAQNRHAGPVVIDIPKDVQFAIGTYIGPRDIERGRPAETRWRSGQAPAGRHPDGGGTAADFIYRRRRHQRRHPEASRGLLRELADLTGFPLTSTLMGLSTPA